MYAVKVVKGNGAVTLTCGTKNDGDVIWKFSGGSLDALLNYSVDKDTQNLILSEVETPMLGEYSCWRGGEMISSTNLLEEEEESEEEGEKLFIYLTNIQPTYPRVTLPNLNLSLGTAGLTVWNIIFII